MNLSKILKLDYLESFNGLPITSKEDSLVPKYTVALHPENKEDLSLEQNIEHNT